MIGIRRNDVVVRNVKMANAYKYSLWIDGNNIDNKYLLIDDTYNPTTTAIRTANTCSLKESYFSYKSESNFLFLYRLAPSLYLPNDTISVSYCTFTANNIDLLVHSFKNN